MAKSLQRKRRTPETARAASARTIFPSAFAGLISTWPTWLPGVFLIIGITTWIYWPALRGELIWDDQWYITMNPSLHSVGGLWKFWFQPGSWVEYYPIEETVLWLQWQLWGDDTLGYHLTNLFLHILNALLVWRLLSKFGLRLAWLGGLAFAVHPVQVESVAYICELKNTLSLAFFLLAMMAWIDYEESHAKNDYQNAFALFLVAMLCKISMAPFPAVILLYAWWKRGRIAWSDARDGAPFLLVALVLVVVTAWSGAAYEKTNHVVDFGVPLGGLLSRIDATGLNATVYFARRFLPWNILFIYSQWTLHPDSLLEYLPWLVMLAVLGALWSRRTGWGRHALLGLGFFLILLSPFLGLTAVSYMNFIWVMDHLLYIPIIGLIGLVVAGLEDLSARVLPKARSFGIGFIASLFIVMSWQSHAFAGLFVNEQTLWTYILQRNPTVWLARDNLGCKLMELERYQEATVQEKDAIQLRPYNWDSYSNLGFALDKLGRPAEAEEQYRKSLRLNPNNPKAYFSLADLQRRAGDFTGAEATFRQGLKVAPEDESLNAALAGILQQAGRLPEAIDLYRNAVASNPDVAQLQYDLGYALLQTGNLSEAVEHLQAAVTLEPKIAAAHENLGAALARTGRLPEAIEQFQAALEIDPAYAAARDNLALALAQSGRIPEAIGLYQAALETNPNDAKARQNLDKLRQYQMQQNIPGTRALP